MTTLPPPLDQNEPEKKSFMTKLVEVFGRETRIILQDTNGPCPLVAICNILLLRNQLTLSSNQVSQEELLSLVAGRLIDANSNVNKKDADAAYVENQQEKIGEAIELLPGLAAGINLNLKFTRIDDFEFSEECAIFDLLDIPLCHGWIIDPQDSDTASAIGCKSYNTLVEELVALDTQICKTDFSEVRKVRRGDLEEEEELLRALKQSETEVSPPTDDSYLKQQEPAISMEVHTGAENAEAYPHKSLIVDDNETLNDNNDDLKTFETASRQNARPSSQCENDKGREQIEAVSVKHEGKDEFEKPSIDMVVKSEKDMEDSDTLNAIPPAVNNSGDEKMQDQSAESDDLNIVRAVDTVDEASDILCQSASPIEELESFKDLVQHVNESECSASSADGSEPIYEGEEYVEERSTTDSDDQDQEPMYKAEQVAKVADETKGKSGITPEQVYFACKKA